MSVIELKVELLVCFYIQIYNDVHTYIYTSILICAFIGVGVLVFMKKGLAFTKYTNTYTIHKYLHIHINIYLHRNLHLEKCLINTATVQRILPHTYAHSSRV